MELWYLDGGEGEKSQGSLKELYHVVGKTAKDQGSLKRLGLVLGESAKEQFQPSGYQRQTESSENQSQQRDHVVV
jgi:hypothetical protein